MRRNQAELVALILAHASSAGVQLLSVKLCAAASRYVLNADSLGSFSASAAARSSFAIGSIVVLYATENGTGSRLPPFSRTTTNGSSSALAFGSFSSASQKVGFVLHRRGVSIADWLGRSRNGGAGRVLLRLRLQALRPPVTAEERLARQVVGRDLRGEGRRADLRGVELINEVGRGEDVMDEAPCRRRRARSGRCSPASRASGRGRSSPASVAPSLPRTGRSLARTRRQPLSRSALATAPRRCARRRPRTRA